MDKHKIPHDTFRKTLERIQIMRKNIRGILVTATAAVTLVAVCIAGSMLPIRAFGDREVAGTEQTNGSATPRDIAIDLSDFFGNAEESTDSPYGDNDFVNPFGPEDSDKTNGNGQQSTDSDEVSDDDGSVHSGSAGGNVNVAVSFLYNNTYSERILLEGETLGVEITVTNTSDVSKEITGIIAYYDANGRMLDIKTKSFETAADSSQAHILETVVPTDCGVSSAKFMLFESFRNLKPCHAVIELTAESADYYGDTYQNAQPISSRNSASGYINSETDTDVFTFVPQMDGLYYFEAFSDIDTYAALYSAENTATPVSLGDNEGTGDNFRISETLQAGKTYYLYVYGRSVGQYSLNYGYAVGNIYGTVSPVRYYDDDMIFNREAEATVTLNTYRTNEHVATLHLKDQSYSGASFASFSLSGIHADDYIVEISRPGYLSCYRKVTLEDNAVNLGSITLIPGDVNADGIIDEKDLALLTASKGKRYGDDGYSVMADFNGDKVIDAADEQTLKQNLNQTVNSYEANIVIPTLSVSVSDTTLTVTGKAKADSFVNGILYFEDICLFEERIPCQSDGTYEWVTELNRTGEYTVEIYEESSAFSVKKTVNYD